MAASLNEFHLVAPKTLLYTPAQHIPNQLIILCTWLGAARKHIQKYITLYQAIAPGGQILVLESDIGTMSSNYARYRRKLEPAVRVVLEVLKENGSQERSFLKMGHEAQSGLGVQENVSIHQRHVSKANGNGNGNGQQTTPTPPSSDPKIILHTFSNGGANTAAQLLISLRSRVSAPLLPIRIFDSGPASARDAYWKLHSAFVLSIPAGFLRLMASVTAHCILLFLYTWMTVSGSEHPGTLQRRVLLEGEECMDELRGGSNESLLEAHVDEKTLHKKRGRICYLYSKADLLCVWTDITEHANDARDKGWDVTEIVFQESGHCAHLAKYPGEYVAAVEKMWSLA